MLRCPSRSKDWQNKSPPNPHRHSAVTRHKSLETTGPQGFWVPSRKLRRKVPPTTPARSVPGFPGWMEHFRPWVTEVDRKN